MSAGKWSSRNPPRRRRHGGFLLLLQDAVRSLLQLKQDAAENFKGARWSRKADLPGEQFRPHPLPEGNM